MATNTCVKCGKTDDVKEYLFLTVNVHTSSSTSGRTTTTTISESLNGTASGAVCGECIRKRRKSYALGAAAGGLFGVILLVFLFGGLVIGNEVFNRNFSTIALCAVAAGLITAIVMYCVSYKREDPFLAGLVKKSVDTKTNPSAAAMVYVPADISLYLDKNTGKPDVAVFKRKNSLQTDLATTLFLILMAGANN